jgi:HD-GYP domain-containing protein (c-di-GMP phosphodiesterase class II)
MNLRPRQLVLLCGLVPTIVAAGLCLYRPSIFQNLEYGTYDLLMRSAATRRPSDRVVIVDIDEYSLSAIGQWPWRRDLVGQLVSRLRDHGAAAVALDIVFAESDRYQGPGRNPDQIFADTLKGGRAVLGYALTFDRAPNGRSSCVQHPIGLALVRRGDDSSDEPFFRASGAVCSLEVLTHAATASGFLNAAPDSDGLLRRVPLLIDLDDRVYPSLALAAFVAATGARDISLHIANVNTASLTLDGRSVPLDGKSNLMLRYRGPKRTFPYVSAADVLSGKADARGFANKIAFVGTTALGTREVVATPLDTLFTGVEVQATVADNLLQQDFIRRHEHTVALETQAVVAVGLIAALLIGRLGLAWGALAVLGCMAATWGASLLLLSTTGTYLSPLYSTVGLIASLVSMTVAAFTIEQRRADHAGDQRTASRRLMVQALLSLTEVRDAETGRHSRRTQHYTSILTQELARHPEFRDYLTPERIELLASLAPLHDIGKVGVPDRLLKKPGMLTNEELEEMRKHPEHGRDVILNAGRRAGVHDDELLAMVKDIAYTHHEKWDGTGYPQGLKGTQIPIAGRIMALVDVYDAVITRRLYHRPMPHDEAVALIVAGSGTHFDPAVVNAFVKVSAELQKLADEGEDQ